MESKADLELLTNEDFPPLLRDLCGVTEKGRVIEISGVRIEQNRHRPWPVHSC